MGWDGRCRRRDGAVAEMDSVMPRDVIDGMRLWPRGRLWLTGTVVGPQALRCATTNSDLHRTSCLAKLDGQETAVLSVMEKCVNGRRDA